MSEDFAVAHVRELCPVCTKETEGSIFMNSRFSKLDADKIREADGKIIWAKEWCPDCKDMKEKGFILIGAVESKTEDTTNPYRSGNIWVVAQEVAEELFAPHGAPASGVAFVDINVAKQMQLPDVNMNA